MNQSGDRRKIFYFSISWTWVILTQIEIVSSTK
jgi:hypothetical protein